MLLRKTKRDIRKARVAPTLEANDTMTVPQPRPKMAPPASVMMAAPGQRQGRGGHVDQEVDRRHLEGLAGVQLAESGLAVLDVVQREEAAQVEGEESHDAQHHGDQE